MSVTSDQIYGFTINGLSLDTTSASGYVDATPFSVSVSAADGITQAAITNDYQIIWWFGDGTYSTDFSPSHTYSWPGVYEIKLGLYNNNSSLLAGEASGILSNIDVQTANVQFDLSVNGTTPFTFSKTVTAFSYIQDRLSWNYNLSATTNTTWNDIMIGDVNQGACFYGYQSCKTGTLTSGPVPLAVDFFTSIKNIDDVNIHFYAENSLSQPLTEIPSSQLLNLRPSWRFTTVSASPLDDGFVISDYTPISSTAIRILSSGELSPDGTIVGLSGTIEFYYIDDTPSTVATYYNNVLSLSANPTVLWLTLDTSQIINIQESNSHSLSNSTISLSSYFFVCSLEPDHINTTINGKIELDSVYWPGVEARFVNTIASKSLTGTAAFISNKHLLNQPVNVSNIKPTFSTIVSGGYNAEDNSSITVDAVFNNSTIPTSGNEVRYSFQKYDDRGNSIGGAYIGTFTVNTSATIASLHTDLVDGEYYYVSDFKSSPISGFNPITITEVLSGSPTINTYTNLNGYSNNFTVPYFTDSYFTRKVNGAFDYGELLKSYALQPTISQNTTLFDVFLTSIAGTSATHDDTFGTVIYEKIANFVSNNSDIHTSNINQFYSLSELLGLEIDNYNYDTPPTLSRITDLYSVQQSKLWGARSQFERNFQNTTGHTNLGSYLSAFNISSAVVSAGQKIVLCDLFDNTKMELIEVPAILTYSSVSARNLQDRLPISAYPTTSYPLTAYPLSAFFGWGIQTPIESNYRVFEYYEHKDNTQKEGLVNWDDPYTTLNESCSSNDDWVKDGGILERIYSYYIHKGLGLIK